MPTDSKDHDFEPAHTSSPTDHVLAELQLYGYRPFHDEPDPRPLPEADAVLGLGGYVCFPGGLMASLLGRPLVLVNADAALLLSNRALLPVADAVAFGFDGDAAAKTRHAVVTGAGGGMGEAIALALLDAGAAVTAIDVKPRPASLAAYDDRPASKLDTLKKLRILIKHAMKKKWISGDPSTGIKRTKVGEVRSFTDDEIRQYENHWPIGTKQRTAFALMLYTGQRRSDIHRMIWQDISHKTGRIKVIQQKTCVKIQVPLHRDLLVVLEKAQRNATVISKTPMTLFTLSHWDGKRLQREAPEAIDELRRVIEARRGSTSS